MPMEVKIPDFPEASVSGRGLVTTILMPSPFSPTLGRDPGADSSEMSKIKNIMQCNGFEIKLKTRDLGLINGQMPLPKRHNIRNFRI